MATRVNRKNAASAAAASPKDIVNAVKNEPVASPKPSVAKSTARNTPIGKRLAKVTPAKKIVKKTIAIKLKAKAKTQLKVLPKALLQTTKTAENRKKLLRNGVKEIKPRKKRKTVKKEIDDSPPVLEPIFPIEENLESKKTPKKRLSKKAAKNTTPDLLDITKVKVENEDDLSLSSDFTDISNNEIPTLSRQVKKPRASRKPKVQSDTLEDVMNDLTFLIKADDVKKEVDSLSESGKSDTVAKPKKLTKRQRIELLKKKMIKKENIENTLSKLDSSDEKVIDMLDLNVKRVKKKSPLKRRHSIEKFPVGSVETSENAPRTIFGHVPRSASPKIKRNAKSRQSIEGSSQRLNPYATRSDSPARMLRNGKQRKLKSTGLLAGLDSSSKKRKRLCSDLSGSEMSFSKMSGYESDSSFSDLSSIHGTESNDPKDLDSTKSQQSASSDTAQNGPIDNLDIIDTNSNVCKDFNLNKPTVNSEVKDDVVLPDKDALLDIMKQAFNDVSFQKSTPKTSPKGGAVGTARFYGRTPLKGRGNVGKTERIETIVTDESSSTSFSESIPARTITSEESHQEEVMETSSGFQESTKVDQDNIETMNDTDDILAQSDDVLSQLEKVLNQQEAMLNQSEETLKQSVLNLPTEHMNEPKEKPLPLLEVPVQLEEASQEKEITEQPTEVLNQTKEVFFEPQDEISETEVVVNRFEITNQMELIENEPEPAENQIEQEEEQPNHMDSQYDDKFGDTDTRFENVSPLVISNHPNENTEEMEVEVPVKFEPMNTSSFYGPETSTTQQADIMSPVVEEDVKEENNMECENSEDIDAEIQPSFHQENVSDVVNEKVPEAVTEEKESPLLKETEVEVGVDPLPEEFMETAQDPLLVPVLDSVEEKNSEETLVGDVSEGTNVNSSDVDRTESDNIVMDSREENVNPSIEESAEELAEKESVLKALGLQSLKAAEEAKQKIKEKPSGSKSDNYTGTLKTVIKINRDKKKGRSTIKMTLQKNKTKNSSVEEEATVSEENYKILKEGATSALKQTPHSSDTAGAQRKSHYSNRSNMDGSSEHTSDGEAAAQDGAIKALVIPEKASSFSIHPGRLCKDECSYCFGKFGLFDTPCHIATIKSIERQNRILGTEKHLTTDSCLCDACYRHVDRKSNTPSYVNKSLKRNALVAPGPRKNHCHVLGCRKEATNILRRKWIIKMRKSICQVINIDFDNPGLHSIPICDEHYTALEHLMICSMCKRRLARNHIHYLGPETIDLNKALDAEGIPLALTDKPVVCKLCKCFASILLKGSEERPEASDNFFKEYKRRLLHFNDIEPMDEAAAEEPIAVPSKADRVEHTKKKKKLVKNPLATKSESDCPESPQKIQERVPSTDTSSQPQSRSESPSDEYNGVDYNTLIPAIAMDCPSDTEVKKEAPVQPVIIRKIGPKFESLRDAVEITKVTKVDKNKNSDIAVQKLGANPSISVRQLFPGEEELPLNASIDFNNVKERTPEGWEKCSSVIQYDQETKRLWRELQKPYGNQSSFLRHLILLEKYFRNGDLVLSARASHHSINYSESVHNRLRAYDNIPSTAGNIQPLSMLPFNKMQKSSSGIITSANITKVPGLSSSISISHPPSSTITSSNCKPVSNMAMSITTVPSTSIVTNNSLPKSTPLTISQLNSPPLLPANATMLQQIRPKMVGAPPGLISLHPGTSRPVAPLVKVPQPQKIKFPITKNWRPNLMPIDPNKKQEKKAGLVQVISGGKPYHISLEDYKKMCAIKRSFEIKQKRLQEAQTVKGILVRHNSVLKSIHPRKGLIISKTSVAPTKTDTQPSAPPVPPLLPSAEGENILEKLDQQVEKLESKLNEKQTSLLLPRIPKSLTVIPQTVTRRPSSPVLLVTPNIANNKS
ncbi:enhanced adult sensory threshold isoform X1 [Leptinotarsa decemlineata]|uniref:enhanced adult sensory threshold isoform X1 n=2 Tax=Leptinotarsa decemlineata TaxID=7539 RepID=UPI003D30B218